MEERHRRPQHHRRCQRKFQPDRSLSPIQLAQRQAQHRSHGHQQQRNRTHGADPEADGEVDQLRVRTFIAGRDAHRLQRHAADRARTRPSLHDLRMHRTGILRPGGHWFRRRPVAEIICRRRFEFGLAARRAEIVSFRPHGAGSASRSRGHLHAANRIDRRRDRRPAPLRTCLGNPRCRNDTGGRHARLSVCRAGSTVIPQTGSRTTAAGWAAAVCAPSGADEQQAAPSLPE